MLVAVSRRREERVVAHGPEVEEVPLLEGQVRPVHEDLSGTGNPGVRAEKEGKEDGDPWCPHLCETIDIMQVRMFN